VRLAQLEFQKRIVALHERGLGGGESLATGARRHARALLHPATQALAHTRSALRCVGLAGVLLVELVVAGAFGSLLGGLALALGFRRLLLAVLGHEPLLALFGEARHVLHEIGRLRLLGRRRLLRVLRGLLFFYRLLLFRLLERRRRDRVGLRQLGRRLHRLGFDRGQRLDGRGRRIDLGDLGHIGLRDRRQVHPHAIGVAQHRRLGGGVVVPFARHQLDELGRLPLLLLQNHRAEKQRAGGCRVQQERVGIGARRLGAHRAVRLGWKTLKGRVS